MNLRAPAQFLGKVNRNSAFCIATCSFSVSALAQNPKPTEKTDNYSVPMGEQPTYGKKYHPGGNTSDLFLEINPLMLIQKGIGVEFEKGAAESWSIGADIIYRDSEVYSYDSGLKGRVQFIALSPKVRIYPMSTLAGAFFGARIILGQQTQTVSGGGITSEKSQLVITPAAHVGYRFVSFSGFTMAAYLGGGLNIPKPELKSDDIQKFAGTPNEGPANLARAKINEQSGLFRPDFGLTVGIAL